MSARWFHRNINGIDAERLLTQFGQDGSFLIRPSHSTINSYTLSVRCNNVCKHIKIQNTGDSGYEIGEGGDKFATLAELVEHFIMKETLRDKTDNTTLVLKYPLCSKEPTSDRYFHGAISANEANDLLLNSKNCKSGSYLVRESRSEPQNYVLSVRIENKKVIHLIINYTHNGYTMRNFNKSFPTLDEFISECIKMCPIVDERDNVIHLKQPLNSSRANVNNFPIRIQELEKENKYGNKNGFSEEFESLQQADGKFLYEREIGCKPENKAKNRFKTILPFDHNRIKLLNRTNEPNNQAESDYINANRITISEEGYSKVYLASQGPLVNTINDFWQMVWQEESQIILMITHEEEKGRSKCARYWPEPAEHNDFKEESLIYEDILVKFVQKKHYNDYVLREFAVSRKNTHNDEKNPRYIYQFQYLAWSDHSVPDNVQNTLEFIENFNSLYNHLNNKSPITVHCSAGIGRTGAIIVIDMMIDKIKLFGIELDIDIYKAVCNLRSQRSGMIQTEKQYQFVYIAIGQFIENFKLQLNNGFSTSTPRTISMNSVHSPH